jgi:hypothetical protein
MDVGVHSSASRATKADAVPVFARGVELRNRVASAGGGRLDRKLVGQVHLIAGEALRGGLGERLDAVPDGDAGSLEARKRFRDIVRYPDAGSPREGEQMGKIALSQNTSLDGVMQSPGPEDVPFKYRGWIVDSTAVPRVPDSTKRKRSGSSRRRTPRPSCSDGSPPMRCRLSGPQRKGRSPTG